MPSNETAKSESYNKKFHLLRSKLMQLHNVKEEQHHRDRVKTTQQPPAVTGNTS
jgi:hypothetical protein